VRGAGPFPHTELDFPVEERRLSGAMVRPGFAGDIAGGTGTIRYMKRSVLTALGLPPRQSGRADSDRRHLRGSAELRQRAIESLLRKAYTGTPLPINIHERLKEEARTLEAIDRRREEEDNPNIGLAVEERILTRELRDLERATVAHDMVAE